MRSVSLWIVTLFMVASVVGLFAQAAPDANLKFEVASVKPNNNIDAGIGGSDAIGNGGFRITGAPLRFLIGLAFGIQERDQLSGGPSWIKTAKYDIIATTELRMPTRAQQRTILQNLLKDRFALTTHAETRIVDVYELTLARADGKLGAGLRAFTGDCNALRATGQIGCYASGSGRPPHTAVGMPLTNLYQGQLGGTIERRIVDKTGLTGRFSWELQIQRDPDDASAPSVFTALQEQLGLKLVPATIPLDVIVIDHVEPPTPN